MGADTSCGVPGEGLCVHFPCGLPAFEQETAFVLLAPPETSPVMLLQSATNPGLCFLTLPVERVAGDYELSLSSENLEPLGFATDHSPAPEEILVLAIVTVHPERMTANLLAPVVIHVAQKRGVQAIRSDRLYSHCHPVSLDADGVGACS